LLVMLSKSNLPWPKLPKAERERMAKEFVELWRELSLSEASRSRHSWRGSDD
jgi:hypothetical protein